MDSLAIFIFIWAVLALFSVWLCKFLYNKYLNKDKTATPGSKSNSRQSSVAPGAKNDKQRLSEPREVGASKAEAFKELAAGRTGGGGGGGGGGASLGRGRSGSASSGGSGGLRRRVVRQSSTGPESRKKRYVPPPSNVVGPEGTSVTWTSQVFRWLYSDLVIVNELLMSWVIALNDSMHKSMEEHGVAVEIVRVLPDSPAPGLSNIFCNCDEHNPADMLITYDCDAMPVLQVKTFRQKSGKMETSHYKVTVSRFRARMGCAMNYNTLKGEMRVEGYPDVRIAMNSVGAIKPMDQDEQQLQAVISEILTAALRETIYPVDFSKYATCPRAEIDPMDIPSNNDSLGFHEQKVASGRRLLVKIVKGEGLKDAKDPYVVVEMDEPPQKNQTGGRTGINPYWDEHFLFELAPQSAEILFEVYDRPANATDQPKFLGLGLVGIDELAVGPASTQILALQPRPYETQQVHGAITVDFVFIEGAEIPAGQRTHKLKEALRISTPAINEHMKNGADLADAAVRALQGGALAGANGQPNKSTVIIHSVQRSSYNPNAYKVELNKDGKIEVSENPYNLNAAVTNAFDPNNAANINSHNNSEATTAFSNLADASDKLKPQFSADSELTTASIADSVSYPLNANELNDESMATKGNASLISDSTADEFGRPNAASSPHHNNYNFTDSSPTNGSSYNYNNSNNNSLQRNGLQQQQQQYKTTQQQQPLNDNDVDQRGRSKKRNFFGTLKKRLSRSKPRTQSVDRVDVNTNAKMNPTTTTTASPSSSSYNNNNGTTPTGTLNGDSRSLSVDRAVMSKTNSLGRRFGGNTLDNSRRSSISESSAISGFSSASNKTYVHEASTLVLETIENGIKRHFIVPLAIAQRPKWRRKGTKLHIYNDHTFIAKHLSGSGLQCSICMKSIPRRPGKQGYECRDCQLICHKQCHVRAPQACPNPTVLSMELTRLNSAAADRSIRKA